MTKYHTLEEIVEAMKYCLSVDTATVFELSSYLVNKHGKEKTKKYIPSQTFIKYVNRSNVIRKNFITQWIAKYKENEIVIDNTITRMSLYINDELHDEHKGLIVPDSPLFGKLPSGEDVKVRAGGVLTLQITVFVKNKKNRVLQSIKTRCAKLY